ncbi:MAG: FtsH protease activity modulator HflK [Nanoarchaeota archaeon]|nr:FtsH protease activity modulator HflK [Nanoarchaeota archaeon]
MNLETILTSPRKIVKWVGGAIIAANIALTSWYTVSTQEEGVVTRLGEYKRSETPGFHLKMPFPIEVAYTPEITKVHRIEIGGAEGDHAEETTSMLTGDENIINAHFIVQYQIKDSKQYLFNNSDPEGTLYDISEAAMRQIVGDHSIDKTLTDGKVEIQNDAKDLIQGITDDYKLGLNIVSVQLQDVIPPAEVRDAFSDVATAREDKTTYINKAKKYANKVIPEARGEAQKLIEDAQAYSVQRVNQARGDVARFNDVYKEYIRNPQITKDRIEIEVMTQIMPNFNKTIIDEDIGNMLPLYNVQQNKGGKK